MYYHTSDYLYGTEFLQLHGYAGDSTLLSTLCAIVANIDQLFISCSFCASDLDLICQLEYFGESQSVAWPNQLNEV